MSSRCDAPAPPAQRRRLPRRVRALGRIEARRLGCLALKDAMMLGGWCMDDDEDRARFWRAFRTSLVHLTRVATR